MFLVVLNIKATGIFLLRNGRENFFCLIQIKIVTLQLVKTAKILTKPN